MDSFYETPGERDEIENINNFVFKKPLHCAPRKKRKILSEETYVKNLQSIIERDFFPNLEALREKVDFLKASESNNIEKLQELHEKFIGRLQNTIEPPQSPATFDTPVAHGPLAATDTPRSNATSALSSGVARMANDLSLDAFMANYTSEDNKSFEEMMERAEAIFKLKHPWLFDAEKIHNSRYAPNLALLSSEIINKAQILSLVGVEDNDTRPKSLENWTYKTYNSLMYVPDFVEHSATQKQQLAKVNKKEVAYENTRFQENPFNVEMNTATMQEVSAMQAYKKEGKVGVDGKELNQMPTVNGYSYLRTPSPAVGVDASPFMTWGEIEGTPCQLDGSQSPLLRYRSTPGPAYKIPKASERDEILLRLNEKVSQTHKHGKERAMSAARAKLSTPKQSSMQRLSSMSPAAQKLLSGNSKRRAHAGIESGLRTAYSPSPLRLDTSPLMPKPGGSNIVRPRTPQLVGLTDNILHLPKRAEKVASPQIKTMRKCAADFF